MITRNMDYSAITLMGTSPEESCQKYNKQYSSFERRQVQSDTAMRNKKGEKEQYGMPFSNPSPKEQ